MKKTLRYFFSIFFLLLFLASANSQTERMKGLRIGFDLSRFALYYLEPERKCYEISADFEVVHNIYPIIECGWQTVILKKTIQDEMAYNYNSKGTFYKIGLDLNLLKNKGQNKYDMVFIGFRGAFANMNHSADNISVNSGYWGNYTGGIVSKNSVNAYWAEVVGGLRAEILKNLFMGWSLSGRIMIEKSKDIYMDPINIPGFGKGNKNSAIGFNYSIYYRIPMFKEKVKPVEEKKNNTKGKK
jgi:hypothetical protein